MTTIIALYLSVPLEAWLAALEGARAGLARRRRR
jgi:hypothetical protein